MEGGGGFGGRDAVHVGVVGYRAVGRSGRYWALGGTIRQGGRGPLGPVAELNPRKPVQFRVLCRELVVIWEGAAQLVDELVVTFVVTPLVVEEVTLPPMS